MKTTGKKTNKSNNVTGSIRIAVFSIILCISTFACLAQMNAKSMQRSNITETYRDTEVPIFDKKATIVQLNVSQDGQQTFITWSVKNQRKNGTYLIERSEDGLYYTIEGLRKGVPTKRKQIGTFRFVNNDLPQGTVYYRVRHIANDNSILLSENVVYKTSAENKW